MICQRCRSSIFTRLQQQTVALSGGRAFPFPRSQFRNYSDGKPTASTTPPPPTPRQPIAGDITVPSPVASATPGVTQPLNTSETVHVDVNQEQPAKAARAALDRPPSSCPSGTRLNGLNYFKNKPDVLALEDSEYPEWLWSLLDDPKNDKKKGGVDPSTLNKKQRKRYEKKMAARAATLPPKIPVHHHATDITPASYNRGEQVPRELLVDAAESIEKRTEITKSAREARRKEIREANFLRGL